MKWRYWIAAGIGAAGIGVVLGLAAMPAGVTKARGYAAEREQRGSASHYSKAATHGVSPEEQPMQSWQTRLLTITVLTLWTPHAAAQDKQKELARSLATSARKVYEGNLQRWRATGRGKLSFEEQNRWSRRWLQAELELADMKEKRMAAYEEHLKRMRTLEELAKQMLKGSTASPIEVTTCEYFRTQAELWWERAKQGPQKAGQ